jgi:hypothetical protein
MFVFKQLFTFFKLCCSIEENKGKSAVRFCRQVAAWFADMFCNFYLAENHKFAKNSITTKAKEKISTVMESFEFWKFFDVCST